MKRRIILKTKKKEEKKRDSLFTFAITVILGLGGVWLMFVTTFIFLSM